jgi:cytochrome c-type biogenesis protein CcmH
MRRRDFLARAALGGAGLLGAKVLHAQQASAPAPAQGTTSNLFDMNQGAAKTVRRPPKAGANRSMANDDRDALERQIRCQCGCTLDVYICRTTDFSCQVSPAMHRDIISLVEGGYSAQEILDAFVITYGERALMAPKREGFNLAGYLVPFGVLALGSVALTVVLRRMQSHLARRKADVVTAPRSASGTPEELAKLDAAVRRDE